MERREEQIRDEQRRLVQEREDLLDEISQVQMTSRIDKEEVERKKQERREELNAMMSARDDAQRQVRANHDEEMRRKAEEDAKFRDMYEDEKQRMRQEGYNDQVFPRVKRAWE